MKSRAIVCIDCTENQRKLESNDQDEIEYARSLTQMTSHAHYHALLYLYCMLKRVSKHLFIYLLHLKSEEKKIELNELEY